MHLQMLLEEVLFWILCNWYRRELATLLDDPWYYNHNNKNVVSVN